jgi:hypothetical protein
VGGYSWGIGYLNNLFAHATNLEEMESIEGASWFRTNDDNLRLAARAEHANLQPGSLPNLTRFEMVQCALTREDMETIINACSELCSLRYYTADEEIGPWNFTPLELIDILNPLKETLKELRLGILPYNGRGNWTSGERIQSLSQFTSLRILDTQNIMWDDLIDEDLDDSKLMKSQCLSNRLLYSINTLIFHEGGRTYEDEDVDEIVSFDAIAGTQIIDLLRSPK